MEVQDRLKLSKSSIYLYCTQIWAADYYQRILKINETSGEIWGALGHCYLMLDDLQKAYNAYQSALYHLPDPKANEIYFRLGIIYKQERKFDLSRRPPSPLTEIDIWFQIIHLYEQQKEADPADAQTWYLLGRCYMAQQKYNDAYDAYQQAVYRDGRNPTFWCSIGVLYYQINQYSDALDAYSRAIRLNPLPDALDAYTRALELDQGNVQIKQRLQLLRNSQTGGAPVQHYNPSNLRHTIVIQL
ncbi:hypothetical protein BSLG_005663 [Batrachochytrium salamandrivorans]|nr:hypothetical protein BSLG_005663 [Batrachochytrium salamandrivorans]